MSIAEAERAAEEQPRLGADRRARDRHLLAVGVDPHLDGVRVVARRAVSLLDDLDAALGRDQRRVDDVDDLVDAPLEGAVQRGDGEQPRVVLGERAVRGDGDPVAAGRGELAPRSGRAAPRAG